MSERLHHCEWSWFFKTKRMRHISAFLKTETSHLSSILSWFSIVQIIDAKRVCVIFFFFQFPLGLIIFNYTLITEYVFSIVKSYFYVDFAFVISEFRLERSQGSSERVNAAKQHVFFINSLCPIFCLFIRSCHDDLQKTYTW